VLTKRTVRATASTTNISVRISPAAREAGRRQREAADVGEVVGEAVGDLCSSKIALGMRMAACSRAQDLSTVTRAGLCGSPARYSWPVIYDVGFKFWGTPFAAALTMVLLAVLASVAIGATAATGRSC
jgi:hypothetical protein